MMARGWSNATETTMLSIPSEGRLKQPEFTARQPLTQTVVNYTPNSGTLYAASQFIATNKQITPTLALCSTAKCRR
jgi:hypothetical protein